MSDDLISSLVADFEKAPVESLEAPARRFLRWLLLSLFSLSLGVWFVGLREDLWLKLADPMYFLEALATLLVALMSVASAFVLSVPGNTMSVAKKVALLIPIFLWAFLLVFQYAVSDYHFLDGLKGFLCSAEIISLGLIPGTILFWMLKRGAPTEVSRSGILSVLGVLALGAVGTQFTCQVDHPIHLFVAHYLPVIMLGLTGLFIGRKVLRW